MGVKMNNEEIKIRIAELREIMKSKDDLYESDQNQRLLQPHLSKEKVSDEVIELTKEFAHLIKNNNFLDILSTRTSKRKYTETPLALDELAYLLWATQGVKSVAGKERKATFRTVPSAGARHPFETYLFVNRVEGLKSGLYHYLALEHKLEFLGTIENQIEKVSEAFSGQVFLAMHQFHLYGQWNHTVVSGVIPLMRRSTSCWMPATCARTFTWQASPSDAVPAASELMSRLWQTAC